MSSELVQQSFGDFGESKLHHHNLDRTLRERTGLNIFALPASSSSKSSARR